MVAVEKDGDVDVDDVALRQLAAVRNAVAEALVDRRANRLQRSEGKLEVVRSSQTASSRGQACREITIVLDMECPRAMRSSDRGAFNTA